MNGQIVEKCFHWFNNQYAYMHIDTYVIMPNHIHMIVWIHPSDCSCCRGGSRTAPTVKRKTLGSLVGAFKTVSTKELNLQRRAEGAKLWQRNYYEHIIRDEEERIRIRKYILENPLHWDIDPENV